MRTLRKLSVLLLPVALLVGACSDDDAETTIEEDRIEPEGGFVEVPPTLVTPGALTVCSDTAREPFAFEDDRGVPVGYDLDLLRAVAADADLDLVVTEGTPDDPTGGLTAGDCDVAATGVATSDERLQGVEQAAAHFDADQSLLVRAEDADAYATLSALAGGTVGVRSGTASEAYARDYAPEATTVRPFDDAEALVAALRADEIDAVLGDLGANAHLTTQGEDVVVTERFPTGEQHAFAVAPGNTEVLEFVDTGLATLRDDGRFTEIYETYFGTV